MRPAAPWRTPSRPANGDWNPWAHAADTLELYARRCRREAEEMTCAVQAAGLLASLATPGETVLDAGCGGGYYYHSLAAQLPEIEYYGLDYTPAMIELARREMCLRTSLTPDRFHLGAIEDLVDAFDTVICFNVLTNSPHYGLPLERLLAHTRRRLLLRESLGDHEMIRYQADPYLDEGWRDRRVYLNTYGCVDVTRLIEANGFRVRPITDLRTGDGVEMVVDVPHYWRILVAER